MGVHANYQETVLGTRGLGCPCHCWLRAGDHALQACSVPAASTRDAGGKAEGEAGSGGHRGWRADRERLLAVVRMPPKDAPTNHSTGLARSQGVGRHFGAQIKGVMGSPTPISRIMRTMAERPLPAMDGWDPRRARSAGPALAQC